MTVKILNMFLKDSRVIERFKPTSTQIQKLKLARLISSKNPNHSSIGLEVCTTIMENSNLYLPIELVNNDHASLAILDRYHEI